jgi:ATP diphosphatase
MPGAMDAALHAQQAAAAKGMDWPGVEGPIRKIFEEIRELEASIARQDAQEIHEETGDILFSVINVCRFLSVSPNHALRDATQRFEARVAAVENLLQSRGRTMDSCSLEELDAAWDEIKVRARQALVQEVDK